MGFVGLAAVVRLLLAVAAAVVDYFVVESHVACVELQDDKLGTSVDAGTMNVSTRCGRCGHMEVFYNPPPSPHGR